MKIKKNELYFCPVEMVESQGIKNISERKITTLEEERFVKVRPLLSGDMEVVDVYFAMNKFPVNTSLLIPIV